MGLGIGEIGAALGGVAQGAPQGLDLYSKYSDIKEQNRKRDVQRQIEGKVTQLAQTGIFKTDPVAGMRQLSEAYGSLGDAEGMQKYLTSADALQKERGTRDGLTAFAASHVSPQATVEHLNNYARTMGLSNKFGYVANADGKGFTVTGFGDDPKTGKSFDNLNDFSGDVMTFLAPGILDPKDVLDWEQKKQERGANITHTQAGTENINAQTQTENQLRDAKGNLLEGQAYAAVGSGIQSREDAEDTAKTRPFRTSLMGAQTGLANANAQDVVSQTDERYALEPGKIERQAADIGLTYAQTGNTVSEAANRDAKTPSEIGYTTALGNNANAAAANSRFQTAKGQVMLPLEMGGKSADIGLTNAQAGNLNSERRRRDEMLPGDLKGQAANNALTDAQTSNFTSEIHRRDTMLPVEVGGKLAEIDNTNSERRNRDLETPGKIAYTGALAEGARASAADQRYDTATKQRLQNLTDVGVYLGVVKQGQDVKYGGRKAEADIGETDARAWALRNPRAAAGTPEDFGKAMQPYLADQLTGKAGPTAEQFGPVMGRIMNETGQTDDRAAASTAELMYLDPSDVASFDTNKGIIVTRDGRPIHVGPSIVRQQMLKWQRANNTGPSQSGVGATDVPVSSAAPSNLGGIGRSSSGPVPRRQARYNPPAKAGPAAAAKGTDARTAARKRQADDAAAAEKRRQSLLGSSTQAKARAAARR